MRRWSIGFLLVLLACVPIFLLRGTGADLLQDSDTKALLLGSPDQHGVLHGGIRARNAPLSWFASDWPLENHFYRPVSTLTFEMDSALYGDNAAGYGITNALLVIGCVLALFWFLRELTNNVVVTAAACVLFAFWSSGVILQDLPLGWVLACLAFAAALWRALAQFVSDIRAGVKFEPAFGAAMSHVPLGLMAFLVAAYLSVELAPHLVNTEIDKLSTAMIRWLPSRTASVMTLFALLGMAAYARYERLGAAEIPTPVSPTDPPATKGTEAGASASRFNALWAVLACVCAALALASYEQAVMLPAALFAVALSLRLQRYRVRWSWQIPFWLLLVGYFFVRQSVLPHGTSAYQQQQFRHGSTVFLSVLDFIFPTASNSWRVFSTLDLLPALFIPALWLALVLLAGNVAAYVACARKWVLALTGLALSVVTYLPMAWLKPFAHYIFWPLAMRSLFTVVLVWVAWDWFSIAASRRVLQAPARPDPAPGSLPHR